MWLVGNIASTSGVCGRKEQHRERDRERQRAKENNREPEGVKENERARLADWRLFPRTNDPFQRVCGFLYTKCVCVCVCVCSWCARGPNETKTKNNFELKRTDHFTQTPYCCISCGCYCCWLCYCCWCCCCNFFPFAVAGGIVVDSVIVIIIGQFMLSIVERRVEEELVVVARVRGPNQP